MSSYTTKIEVDLGDGVLEAELDVDDNSATLIIEVDDGEPIRMDMAERDQRMQIEMVRSFLGQASAAGQRIADAKALSAAKPRAFAGNGGRPARLADGGD